MGKKGTAKVKERRVIKTTCKSCHGGCGVLVTVEDGAITRIEGNPETPTQGPCVQRGFQAFSMSAILTG